MAYSYDELRVWAHENKPYPMADSPNLDYHRMQLERALWDSRDRMKPPIFDIGAEWKRPYMDPATLTTLNATAYEAIHGPVQPDVFGSITRLPLLDKSVGTILCTETLEHVPNLFRAVGELKRILQPGGWLFIATPFMWPVHRTNFYGDFWRITEEAYRFMLNDFEVVNIQALEMLDISKDLWNEIQRHEVMGSTIQTQAPTGYFVAARK